MCVRARLRLSTYAMRGNSMFVCICAACNLNGSYDTVAQGYGGNGLTVSTLEDTRARLQQAQAAARSGTPMLVNVRIGKTSFREGSLSV